MINANLERNGKPVAPTNLSDFRILPGVAEATRLLKEAGFLLVIVTNQPDVANGLTPKATVEAMHAEIMRQCRSIIVCFHADADNCSCRKPKPGMIIRSSRRHRIDLAASYLVGDRWRDVHAGRSAGCRTIFVDYGYPQDQPHQPDELVHSLREAARFILYAVILTG